MAMKANQPVPVPVARSSVAARRSSRKTNSTEGRPGWRTLSTVWKWAPSTSGQSSRMASVPVDFGHDSAISRKTLSSPAVEPRTAMRPGWHASPAIEKRA